MIAYHTSDGVDKIFLDFTKPYPTDVDVDEEKYERRSVLTR